MLALKKERFTSTDKVVHPEKNLCLICASIQTFIVRSPDERVERKNSYIVHFSHRKIEIERAEFKLLLRELLLSIPRSIFHAHNWQFNHVGRELRELVSIGFDAVQISPAQKSPHGDAWFLRYQPFDHLVIDGLGSSDDLRKLCSEARSLGILIIADVVFNHMAVPRNLRRNDWISAEAARVSGDPEPMKKLRRALDQFPHLSSDDFQPWKDMQGVDWDNDNRYDSWGNGEWPELIPNNKVISLHIQHLTQLFGAGVRGFRFDAVKHMRVPHISHYIEAIRNFSEDCFVYGEVFSGDRAMHQEYQSLFPTTDFPFLIHLREKLIDNTTFTVNSDTDMLSSKSIRFGRNHDTVLNPPALVSGFIFPSPELTLIASCLSLLIGGGSSLVYVDDFKNRVISQCVNFRKTHSGLTGAVWVEKTGSKWNFKSDKQIISIDLSNESMQHLA
jgi:alpha-amylase